MSEENKMVTPEEYVATCISCLHESNYFVESNVSEDQMRELFWEKIAWKGKVNEGYFALDAEELDEVLVKGIEIGVDNALASLTEKGMLQIGVSEKGNIDYTITERGEHYADQLGIVRVIKKHGKKTDTTQ